MSTVEETSTQKDRRLVYIVITVALVLLLIICFIFYRSAQSRPAGPGQGQPVDRGAPESRCARRPVAGANRRACSATTEGRSARTRPARCVRRSCSASSPTARPDPAFVRSSSTAGSSRDELLVIQIYCPDELPRFQQMVEKLKTAARSRRLADMELRDAHCRT